MAAAFSMLLAKIAAAVQWFGLLFVAVFAAIWLLLTDVVCWVMDKALGVAVNAASGIDTTGIDTNLAAWGALPGEVVNILLLLGVPQAIGIITAAIGIRLVLQLIPFTRLGS
ncbi:DUF2523 family protein [Variovorax sp. VNK109]|uniref:DUF2523 family protein n=1 Tax=Variovorax sp. VNK109 TaxID=3400919 RepID=UPI003C0560FC